MAKTAESPTEGVEKAKRTRTIKPVRLLLAIKLTDASGNDVDTTGMKVEVSATRNFEDFAMQVAAGKAPTGLHTLVEVPKA